MRSFIFLALSMLFIFSMKSQELTDEHLRSMVQLVDGELVLNTTQEEAFMTVLRSSYEAVQAIQRSGDADVVKLHNMTLVQDQADREIQKIFSTTQYKAYRNFMDGGVPTVQSYADKVEALSKDLGLKEGAAEKFTAYLNELDVAVQGMMVSGRNETDLAKDLLTEILATDISLIGLLGKEKYSEFFALRAAGALSDVSENGSGSIEQVLLFYDLSQSLKLTKTQSRDIIALILDNEYRLQSIRNEFMSTPALLQEKLRLEEQKGLLRLQEMLTDEQIEIFFKLIEQ